MKVITSRFRGVRSRAVVRFSRVLDVYGRYLALIYGIYIVLFSSLTFASMKGVIGLSTLGVFLSMFIFGIFHLVVVSALEKKESHPYQLLYHQRVKALMFWISFVGFISLLSIETVMLAFNLETNFGFVTLLQIIENTLLLLISIFMVSATQVTYGFSYHKETRLCLRLILDVFAQKIENEHDRMKIAHRNLRWFRRAFSSCNSFLTQKPRSVELNDLQSYSDAIFRTVQLGNTKEVKEMYGNLEMMLNSLGQNRKQLEFKGLMTALKYIKEKPDKRRRVLSYDLRDLYRSSTRLDRAKARIKSPLILSIIAITGLIIALVQLLMRFLYGS